MKKIQTAQKLILNKQTIIKLTETEGSNIKGGFTYSLSLGDRCKLSKQRTADNAFECGRKGVEIAAQ